MSEPTTRRVLIETATAQNVLPFGTLLGGDAGAPAEESIYYEGSVNVVYDEFATDDDAVLITSRPQPRDLTVRWMERHPKHTQAFIPLGGSSFVMVLAPPSEEEVPDLEAVRAFRFDGSRGMLLKANAWHDYPYALHRNTELVIVMRRETMRNLRVLEDGESHGEDLVKVDVARRTGVTLELSFGAPQTEIG